MIVTSQLAAARPIGVERKTPRELALMREAGRIVARALHEVCDCVKPGITTRHLDAIAEAVILKHHAIPAFKGYPGPYPYPASTCISVNEELVHGIPGDRILHDGDIVSIDCGVAYLGYYADSAVSIGVGRTSPLVRQLLSTTESALQAGIQHMRVGQSIGDVAAALQAHVEQSGFYVVHEYRSHGIGRRMHEEPFIPNFGRENTGLRLRPGMVIALEPMVLTGTSETTVQDDQWTVVSSDGSLTAHFEHTVLVTDDTPEILTRL